MQILLLLVTSCVASGVAAIVGFGGGVVLLPVLIAVCGVREAIPVLVITQLAGNLSRVMVNRNEIDLKVVGWFSLGAVPFAIIGGCLFAAAPLPWLARGIGCFLILLVIGRRWLKRNRLPGADSDATASVAPRILSLCVPKSRRAFAGFGAVSSFLGAIAGTVGPITVAFFSAFGLTRGALIGTKALCAVVMHTTKLAAYGGTSVLTRDGIIMGVILTPAVLA